MSVAQRISCPLCKGQIRTEPGRKRQVCQHCGQVFSWGLTPDGSSRALQEEAVSLAHLGSATLVRSKSLPCQSCGAEFSVSDKILSVTCPFCDTALVRVNGQSGEVGIEVPVPNVGGLLRMLFAAAAFIMLSVFL
ncbi:MAG: hypothetical protein AAFP68_21460, partial [Pseudomonadota bacterium]